MSYLLPDFLTDFLTSLLKVVRIAEARRQLLENMSPMLQGEVAWHVHHGWLLRVGFLFGVQRQFLVELATHLRAIVFAPSDVIPTGTG